MKLPFSPKKSNSKDKARNKSPSKVISSPQKSPKKRKKKVVVKQEKKDHDGTILANPQFDPDRTAQRFATICKIIFYS